MILFPLCVCLSVSVSSLCLLFKWLLLDCCISPSTYRIPGLSSSLFYLCDETLWPKTSWERKDLFGWHFNIIVLYGRQSEQELKQGRYLVVRSKAEATKGYCILACSPMVFSTHFLIGPSTTSSRMAQPKIWWVHHHQLRKFPSAWSHGGIFLTEFSSFQITIICVK